MPATMKLYRFFLGSC